jgi:hypothetical protein
MLGTSNSYVASTPRKDFQVILCIFDGPVGCMIVKFLNKVKDDSTFSPKTKSPSRATTGGTPPKQSLFSQKTFILKRQTHPDPGVWAKRTRGASGQRAKMDESGRPTPPAGYDPSPSPLCLRATRGNDQFHPKFA